MNTLSTERLILRRFTENDFVAVHSYDNVIFVIGRGWNNYNFEKYILMNPKCVTANDKNAYERNRNL